MKNIIAHRGFWLEVSEQNHFSAFERALSNGFGIETDLRDRNATVVISHDMPNSKSMSFKDFLSLCREYSPELSLALNIKADGLQQSLIAQEVNNQHFYFDMSVPDMLGYTNNSMNVYTRYSDIEQYPALYNDCKGVWLDNFSDAHLDLCALKTFLKDGKEVILVSPELHKRDEKEYWCSLKEHLTSNPSHELLIGLCTDFPLKARDYFNEK